MGWRTAKVTDPAPDNMAIMNEQEAHFLGVLKLIRGVKDEEGNVKGKTFYNLAGQSHRPWFLLDLETGQRGVNIGSEEN